jgi:ASPIC/UnbV protein/VCBS repeat protein/HEAT repeat protein
MSLLNKQTVFILVIILVAVILLQLNLPIHVESKSINVVSITSKLELSNKSIDSAFTEQSLYKNISHAHIQTSKKLSALNETLGSGVCTFDFDNDGWIDVFFVGGSGHTRHYGKDSWWHSSTGNALFRNIKGNSFENVTEQVGLNKKTWGMGCASTDLDNDGDSDLFITAVGKNLLYRNNGNGTFTDITQSAGIHGDHWSTSVSIADYDADGLPDIYIANYIDFNKGARTFEFNAGYESTLPVSFNVTLYDAVANQLYKNMGKLQFEENAVIANVNNSAGRTLSTTWLNINNDRFADLLVINDRGSPSQLFINNQDGTFSKAGAEFRVETTMGGHSVVIGDLDNNSHNDFVISTPVGLPPLVLINNEQSLNDVAWDNGVASTQDLSLSGWGNAIADFNNDGWLDIYFANGMTIPDSNTPYVAQGQNNQLLFNIGDGQFKSASINTDHNISSRAVAYADYDNDGDIDLFITNNNNTSRFLTNDNDSNNWLGIELVSKEGSHDSLGTSIEVIFSEDNTQRQISRDNLSRSSFLSHSEHRIHFGLGKADRVNKINITWPNGSTSTFNDIAINQYVRIDEKRNSLSKIEYEFGKENNFSNKLKPPFDKYKAEYLAWRAITSDFKNGAHELFEFFKTSNDDEKLKILSILDSSKTNQSLPFLHYALSLDNTEIRLNAIQQLKEQEYEPSIYWLLELFSGESVELKCQLTKTFEFFFHEEEAVTHRKYLSIPYLIKMLDDESDQAKICALDALAEAERYRGINTIYKLLNSDNEEVQIKAVSTLGKTRERKYLPKLTNLLLSKQTSPKLTSHTLIALKRLNDKNIDKHLNRLISLDSSKIEINKLTNAILTSSYLLHDATDETVISPNTVIKLAMTAIDNYMLTHDLINIESNPDLLKHYFSILTYGHNSNNAKYIKPLLESSSKTTRDNANEALIKIGAVNLPKADTRIQFKSEFNETVNIDEFIEAHIASKIYANRFESIDELIKLNNNLSNALLLKLINHPKIDIYTSKYIVSVASENNSKNMQLLLIKALASKHAELKSHTIEHLHTQLDNKNIQNILHKIFTDETENEQVRFKAANLLIPVMPDILDQMIEQTH